MNNILALFFLFVSQNVWSEQIPNDHSMNGDQILPSVDQKKKKDVGIPDEDQVLPRIEINDPALKERIVKASSVLKQILGDKNEPKAPVKKEEVIASETMPTQIMETEPAPIIRSRRPLPKSVGSNLDLAVEEVRPGVQIYRRNVHYAWLAKENEVITLPSGSSAVATLLGGVELANEVTKIEARVDYTFLGPNRTVVGLKDCYIWLEMKANYTTERLYGTPYALSCRAPNRVPFELALAGHIKDGNDEYQGIKGKLLANGKAAAAALSFVQGSVHAFGQAMAAAQVQTEVVASQVATAQGTNVRGNSGKYIAGETLAGASANFLDWWINFYTSLAPTIAVGPGSKIFITIEGGVNIPRMFFVEEKAINTKAILKNGGKL